MRELRRFMTDGNLDVETEGLPVMLDAEDLLNFLRISRRGLYRVLHDPDLHAFKDEGGDWNVLREDLVSWLERNRLR